MALAACGAPVGGAAKREQHEPRKRNGNAATNAERHADSNTAGDSLLSVRSGTAGWLETKRSEISRDRSRRARR